MSLINNSSIDPNKILPMRYKWARAHYKNGVANNWIPEEVSMQKDVEQWKHATTLTEEERQLIFMNLGFFSTAESLTANNIVLALYKHITNPECRQFLLRQAYEEAIHTDTFIYCCDSLGLDPDEVYTVYQRIPIIAAKDQFVIDMTKHLMDPNAETQTWDGKLQFVKNLIGYYVIMEGIFFYAGFAMMLAMKRQGKMIGLGEQFEFIMRDESVHLAFGCDLIKTLCDEDTSLKTDVLNDYITKAIITAVQLETEYAYEVCPKGILGINPKEFERYVKFIADRRLQRLGLEPNYKEENPFPWMSNTIDLNKEKNFFETTVTEYQPSGVLDWSDDADVVDTQGIVPQLEEDCEVCQ